MRMDSLKGKNIWIIGASSGIGAETARELARRGANIALSARDEDALKGVAESLSSGDHIIAALDVSDADAVGGVVGTITGRWKKLDSVIFLAAIYSPHTKDRRALDFAHKMVDVNFKGAMSVVETVLPVFEKQGFGQYVLCGSVAGYRGLPYGQPYCATKAAIASYAESLKIEMEPKNIDVRLISPGFVKTRLTAKNDFSMPMIIEAEEAGRRIADGIAGRAFEIHFPKRLTVAMKILRILPYILYFPITRMMQKQV